MLVYLREGTAGVPAAQARRQPPDASGRSSAAREQAWRDVGARRPDPARSQRSFDPPDRQPQPPLRRPLRLRHRDRRHDHHRCLKRFPRDNIRTVPWLEHALAHEKARRSRSFGPALAGWREYVHLPELGIGPLIAKLDTGARSAALHAENITVYVKNNQSRIRFDVPVKSGSRRRARAAICALADARRVKNTGGRSELRQVVETDIRAGSASSGSGAHHAHRPHRHGRADAARPHHHQGSFSRPSGPVVRVDARLRRESRQAENELRRDVKIALLTRNAKLYSHQRIMEAAVAARPRDRADRLSALLHEHHLATAGTPLSRRKPDRVRRGHSAHRRVAHVLRARRAATVRDDGRVSR